MTRNVYYYAQNPSQPDKDFSPGSARFQRALSVRPLHAGCVRSQERPPRLCGEIFWLRLHCAVNLLTSSQRDILSRKDLHQFIAGHVKPYAADLPILNLKEGGAGIHPAPLVLACCICRGVLDGSRGPAPWPFAEMDYLGALLVCRHRLNSERDFGIRLGKIV